MPPTLTKQRHAPPRGLRRVQRRLRPVAELRQLREGLGLQRLHVLQVGSLRRGLAGLGRAGPGRGGGGWRRSFGSTIRCLDPPQLPRDGVAPPELRLEFQVVACPGGGAGPNSPTDFLKPTHQSTQKNQNQKNQKKLWARTGPPRRVSSDRSKLLGLGEEFHLT